MKNAMGNIRIVQQIFSRKQTRCRWKSFSRI